MFTCAVVVHLCLIKAIDGASGEHESDIDLALCIQLDQYNPASESGRIDGCWSECGAKCFIANLRLTMEARRKYHFSADPTRRNTQGCITSGKLANSRAWCVVVDGPLLGLEAFEANVRAHFGEDWLTEQQAAQAAHAAYVRPPEFPEHPQLSTPAYLSSSYPSPAYGPEYAPPGYAPPEYAPPGYAPPGYAPPGYAPPEYAPPEYAPPEYAPAEYTPPRYALPEYALPEYAPPGYAPPGYAPPGYVHEGRSQPIRHYSAQRLCRAKLALLMVSVLVLVL